MTSTHWLLIAGILIAFGAIGATAQTWAEVTRPGFILPALAQVGLIIKAIYSDKPGA